MQQPHPMVGTRLVSLVPSAQGGGPGNASHRPELSLSLKYVREMPRKVMGRRMTHCRAHSGYLKERGCLTWSLCDSSRLVAPTDSWSTQPFPNLHNGAWIPPGVLSSCILHIRLYLFWGFPSLSLSLLAEVLSIKITVRKGRIHILAFLSESLPDI